MSAVTCRKVQNSHSDQLKLVLLPPFSFPQARRFLRTLLRPRLDLRNFRDQLFDKEVAERIEVLRDHARLTKSQYRLASNNVSLLDAGFADFAGHFIRRHPGR